MRRKALLSVMTLYHHDQTIFDNLVLPTTPTPINGVEYIANIFTPNKEALTAGILLECAELEALYPDPETLKEAVKFWSVRNLYRWQKMLNTMCYSYNPIWNVDGTTTTQRTGTRTGTGTQNVDETNGETWSKEGDKTTGGTETGSGTDTIDESNTRSVSAFNSSAWENADRNVTDRDESHTASKTLSGTEDWSESDTMSGTRGIETTTSDSGSTNETETNRRTGNIGVTMTQQMIEAERDLALFDFYDMIIKDFKRNFCLMVY